MAVTRFSLITEADARRLEIGTTVELDRGGLVTPLAKDTLKARRITVVPAGTVDASLPEGLAPAADVARIAIGADHNGVALKTALIAYLRGAGKAVTDHGTLGPDRVDYPDIAASVATAVARGEADAGIVIDTAGLASAIAANKVRGARAAMCSSVTLARHAREHAGANILTLGAAVVSDAEAKEIVSAWLTTAMREGRYIRRLLKVRRLEERS